MTPAVPPKTRYAKSGDVHIAYQIVGDGDLDLVVVPPAVSHLELAWEEPSFARFLGRLASFARVIVFDKRGTGLSDRVSERDMPTLEQRMDDVRAVMDSTGSERAALLGVCDGGSMSALFAATHPTRTLGLALFGAWRATAGNQILRTEEWMRELVETLERTWGEGLDLPFYAPSRANDEIYKAWWARLQRLGASPGAACTLLRMNFNIDIGDVLPTIRVPTLVMHRAGDRVCRVEGGRYTAERIPGAKYVELPGEDHLPWVGDQDAVIEEIQEFLTGARPDPQPDRVLATVLFVDIVGSTQRAAELGDRRWKELIERFYAVVRQELTRFRGRELDTAGDGVFAAFDGPARGIRCARRIVEAVHPLSLEVRAGLHTGECETMGDKLGGIAVHIGARIASAASGGEVLVSGTVKDLVAGSGIEFMPRGVHALKGVPAEWPLFVVATDTAR
jgi:pimeloyl-ACP methyl ester carboxylesterase